MEFAHQCLIRTFCKNQLQHMTTFWFRFNCCSVILMHAHLVNSSLPLSVKKGRSQRNERYCTFPICFAGKKNRIDAQRSKCHQSFDRAFQTFSIYPPSTFRQVIGCLSVVYASQKVEEKKCPIICTCLFVCSDLSGRYKRSEEEEG